MSVNNVHDANAAAGAMEHAACPIRDASDYHLDEGKINIAEQLCDELHLPLLLNETSYSQISCPNREQMLKKIKRKRSHNSKPLKNLVKGKPEKDKTQEAESSTNASNRENCDVEYPVSLHIQQVSFGEPALNSSILDEILSEKKRMLLESSEISEFLQSRIRT